MLAVFRSHCAIVAVLAAITAAVATPLDAQELGRHGFVQSGEVQLHYVTQGSGPVVVMVHGFPDYWYTWRNQLPALGEHFQVVAYDQRGYNKSDQPSGVDNYKTEKLVADLLAVVDHFTDGKAIIVGHDWGGLVAWTFAMTHPDRTDRIAVLNLPHPRGLLRELAENPQQRLASAYARAFQRPDAATKVTPEALVLWVKGENAKEKYLEAFRRSSIEGMLNYYKANYPGVGEASEEVEFPPVKCPVLMIHGLKDRALLPGGLNDTWLWIDNRLTLVTVPNAGHFVQHDAAEFVTGQLVGWLTGDG